MESPRVLIVGGGAAGMFAAITCARANPQARVRVYELTGHLLAKVKISGGGRCNVTHACFEPRELVKRYPRGSRELIGPFNRWGPREMIAWLQDCGVELKTEADGRMFPVTDDSVTIVECLLHQAEAAGVTVFRRVGVRSAERREGGGFVVTFTDDSVGEFDRMLIATGGNRGSSGLLVAEKFGHTIEEPVPSLFTFNIKDARLTGLEGLSVPDAVTKIAGTKLRERGPILVTHWGLSGPAVLKLSAWGARELANRDYRATVIVSWVGETKPDDVAAQLADYRRSQAKKKITTVNPFGLPSRLWDRLVSDAGVSSETVWASLSKAAHQGLVSRLTAMEFSAEGKSMNKEEFVTCGGVRLKEIDFKTMESRVCPGLHFAGEVLDIDGITGGFNFQAAWTTGRLAGLAMAGNQSE